MSWDLGPGAEATVAYSPTTYVVRRLSSCTFLLLSRAPGATAVLSSVCGVPARRTAAARRPPPQASLETAGKAGEHFPLSVFLEDFLGLCLLLRFPQKTSALNGSCVTKALGTVTFTHLVEGALSSSSSSSSCLLCLRHLSRTASRAALSAGHSAPPQLLGAGALTVSSQEGTSLDLGASNRVLTPTIF